MARIGAAENKTLLKKKDVQQWREDKETAGRMPQQWDYDPNEQIKQRQNPLHIDPKNGMGGAYGAGGGGAGGTKNPYEAQANALYEQLMNRGDFRYDLQGDMLYRQYADQYSQMGKTAMRDAMGTAAGLTGGYGNSYAQQVGNQAYQGYLGQLNDMVPEFYDRAYNEWLNEGTDLQNRYQLALQMAGAYGAGTGGAGGAGAAAGGVQTVGGVPNSAYADYVATHAPEDWGTAFGVQDGMVVNGPQMPSAPEMKAMQDLMAMWRRRNGQ